MRKRIILAATALIAVVLIALFLDRSVFVIRYVRINGDTGMSHDDVVRAAGVDLGGRMRSADVDSIVRNIELSGALRCTGVEKEYPSTIVINVERRQGRMVAECGGNIVLMDESGYVISMGREVPEGDNLYVTGLDATQAVPGRLISADKRRISAMCEVAKAIRDCGASELVSELNVADVNGLYLYSRTGIQVLLGDTEELENKLVWMKYALIDLESRGETSGKLDVTGGGQADYSAN